MSNPDDLKYHKEHTWARIEGSKATIGITDFAQKELGDIVYIDLPEVDASTEMGSDMSEIESTKATSAVIAPVSGKVIKINEDLSDTPEIINEDPYGKGWIAVIELADADETDRLLDSSSYETYLEEEAK